MELSLKVSLTNPMKRSPIRTFKFLCGSNMTSIFQCEPFVNAENFYPSLTLGNGVRATIQKVFHSVTRLR